MLPTSGPVTLPRLVEHHLPETSASGLICGLKNLECSVPICSISSHKQHNVLVVLVQLLSCWLDSLHACSCSCSLQHLTGPPRAHRCLHVLPCQRSTVQGTLSKPLRAPHLCSTLSIECEKVSDTSLSRKEHLLVAQAVQTGVNGLAQVWWPLRQAKFRVEVRRVRHVHWTQCLSPAFSQKSALCTFERLTYPKPDPLYVVIRSKLHLCPAVL